MITRILCATATAAFFPPRRASSRLLDLRHERRDEGADLLIEFCDLAVHDIDELQPESYELGVVVRKLTGEGEVCFRRACVCDVKSRFCGCFIRR